MPAAYSNLTTLCIEGGVAFREHEATEAPIRAACAAHPDVASFEPLGESEEGRLLFGVVLGTGPRVVSLIAGAHADEPVGPETLRTFILESLRRRSAFADLFEAFRFVVVPHINPDGEARNRPWIEAWPDLAAFLQHVDRELPGRDLEFGFPAMRAENQLVAGFLRRYAPFSLHMSLHGMAFSEGAMLLIERHWAGRTQPCETVSLRPSTVQACLCTITTVRERRVLLHRAWFYHHARRRSHARPFPCHGRSGHRCALS